MCCKVLEPVVPPASKRKIVVLTSSTLYGVWDQPHITEHTFEMEAIAGRRVRDLKRAL
jgi:hypothetical protein